MKASAKVLVTGAAGFIGFWLTERLAQQGVETIGVDNLNDYYAPEYKRLRLSQLGVQLDTRSSGGAFPNYGNHKTPYGTVYSSAKYPALRFVKLDIADRERIIELFNEERPTHVVNLAAQAGVRWSLEHPYDYLHSNIEGFLSILEAVRHFPVRRLVYASSSSVYGSNVKVPFAETDAVDSAESLYAVTKRTNEQMARVYERLYGVSATGLRFFTVYGPWGRPDMAPMLFARAIKNEGAINVFNHGDMQRDFTYVGDIVDGVEKVLWNTPGDAPHKVYNIGHGSPVNLLEFIEILEEVLGKKSKKRMLPMQPGDVPTTYADTTALEQDYGYKAVTDLHCGLEAFASWLDSEEGKKTLVACYGD